MIRQTQTATHRFAGVALTALTIINLLNYLDRYLVSALAQSLKLSSLALNDFQLGLLAPGFLIVYMLSAPAFGTAGDTRSRPRIIAFGIACWSLATGLSGTVQSFWALMCARAAVGVGEAAYGTIAPGLLADYFRRDQRGRIMAVFYCAIPVGAALGYMVGGWVDQHLGWRMAFFVAGFPGLILAILVWLLPDPPRGANPRLEAAPSSVGAAALWLDYRQRTREVLSSRAYRFTVLGYAAYTFGVGALGFWMPSFLERVRGLPRIEATVGFGAIVAVCGFAGTLAGGWMGDRLARRSHQAFLWMSGIVTLIAAPLVWLALTTESNLWYWISMIAAQLCLWLSVGPVNAAIINLSAPSVRATAFALSILTIHLLGDAISPPLIGLLSGIRSLESAMTIVPASIALAAGLWMYGARVQRLEPAGREW